VDISGTSIPAISFIRAIKPTRRHQEAVRRLCRFLRSRARSTAGAIIPKRYCKPFAIERKNADASVE